MDQMTKWKEGPFSPLFYSFLAFNLIFWFNVTVLISLKTGLHVYLYGYLNIFTLIKGFRVGPDWSWDMVATAASFGASLTVKVMSSNSTFLLTLACSHDCGSWIPTYRDSQSSFLTWKYKSCSRMNPPWGNPLVCRLPILKPLNGFTAITWGVGLTRNQWLRVLWTPTCIWLKTELETNSERIKITSQKL